MRTALGIVFAGGRVPELSVLTDRRPKSAVIMGGIYRTIDFALTNLANAGVGQVGILTQYRPSALVDHVGTGMAWDFVGTTREVRFLPPSLGNTSDSWYRGPADALYQNIDFIERNAPDDVLAISGDHAYHMDFGPLLHFHYEKGADLTMVFVPVDEGANRFGIGELNAAGQIINFTEKPEYPRSHLASMSVYVLRREVLIEELQRSVRGDEGNGTTFQIHEVLRRMMTRRRAYGFIHHGPWEYGHTLDEYYGFHQKLLGDKPKIDLCAWQVRSNMMARRVAPDAPARYLPGAVVENSLVPAGCTVAGTLKNSVLSPGVRIGKNAMVDGCVLWDNVVVEDGATLSCVISDKRSVFGQGCVVGAGEAVPNAFLPKSLTCGVTVVGMDVRVGNRATIGKNCILHPDLTETDFEKPISSGQTVTKHVEEQR